MDIPAQLKTALEQGVSDATYMQAGPLQQPSEASGCATRRRATTGRRTQVRAGEYHIGEDHARSWIVAGSAAGAPSFAAS